MTPRQRLHHWVIRFGLGTGLGRRLWYRRLERKVEGEIFNRSTIEETGDRLARFSKIDRISQ